MVLLARDIEMNSAVYNVEKIDILRMISLYHRRRSPRLHTTSTVSAQSVIILVFWKSLSIVRILIWFMCWLKFRFSHLLFEKVMILILNSCL